MARVRYQVQDKTKFCLWNPLRPTSSPTSTSHLPLLPFFPTLVSTPHRAGEGLSEDGSVLPKCVYLIASSKWGCTWSSGVTQEVPATPGLAHRCQGLWDWHLGLLGKSPKKLLKPLSCVSSYSNAMWERGPISSGPFCRWGKEAHKVKSFASNPTGGPEPRYPDASPSPFSSTLNYLLRSVGRFRDLVKQDPEPLTGRESQKPQFLHS